MVAAVLLHGQADFSWTRWTIHPSTVIGSALFLLVYFMAIGPWRTKHNWGPMPSVWQPVSFVGGVLVLLLSLNGPLHDLGDNYLFSAHMIQHLIITLIVPPLWLMGLPDWSLRRLLRHAPVRATMRALTGPLVAYAVYNLVFIGWHFPALYNYALINHNVHIGQHMMFIGAATLMWWPVVEPVPELARLQPPV